jgi:putative sterol carrier protein
MQESPREIFERAAAAKDQELEGLDGRSLRFDIQGHGSWHLTIKGISVQVAENTEPADTVVACNEADFYGLAGGGLNLVTAWMRGQISVEGDPLLAQKLNSVMRARAYGRSQGLPA